MKKLHMLCARSGLSCAPVENGGCRIHTADGLTVTVRLHPSGWLAEGEIVLLPENKDDREDLCDRALRIALARLVNEAEDAAPPQLAIHDDRVFLQSLFTDIDRDDLINVQLERFFNLQEVWKKILAQTHTAPASITAPLPFFSPEMFG